MLYNILSVLKNFYLSDTPQEEIYLMGGKFSVYEKKSGGNIMLLDTAGQPNYRAFSKAHSRFSTLQALDHDFEEFTSAAGQSIVTPAIREGRS